MPSSGQFKLSDGPDKAGNAWSIPVFLVSSAEREVREGGKWEWLGEGRGKGRKERRREREI